MSLINQVHKFQNFEADVATKDNVTFATLKAVVKNESNTMPYYFSIVIKNKELYLSNQATFRTDVATFIQDVTAVAENDNIVTNADIVALIEEVY